MVGVALNRAVHGMRATSWLELLKCAYFILIASFIVGLMVPGEVRTAFVKPGTLVLIMLLVAAKDMAHAPEAIARWRAANEAGQDIQGQLASLLPPGLRGWLQLERQMWRGCAAWLLRRPNPARRPAGVALSYLERGSYGTMAGIILVSVFAEMPVSHLVASVLVTDPAKLLTIHVLLGVAAVYSLVWLAGERWHMASGYHVLENDVLDLKIGARAQARIPLGVIISAAHVRESRADWCRRYSIDIRDTTIISPIDKPNLVLTLAADAQVQLSLFQLERNAPRHVFLYLDRPELLLANLGCQ